MVHKSLLVIISKKNIKGAEMSHLLQAVPVEEGDYRVELLRTPALFLACKRGREEEVEALLVAGHNADEPAVHESGYCDVTPLLGACSGGHLNIVKRLIRAGANVNFHCRFGSALDHAIMVSRTDIVAVLLEAGAITNSTSLVAACGVGSVPIVEMLLAAGVDKDADDGAYGTPLYHCCRRGKADVARVLLNAGAGRDRRVDGDTPLHMASYRGHTDVVEVLLEAGADPLRSDDTGKTSLELAISEGHKETALALARALKFKSMK